TRSPSGATAAKPSRSKSGQVLLDSSLVVRSPTPLSVAAPRLPAIAILRSIVVDAEESSAHRRRRRALYVSAGALQDVQAAAEAVERVDQPVLVDVHVVDLDGARRGP